MATCREGILEFSDSLNVSDLIVFLVIWHIFQKPLKNGLYLHGENAMQIPATSVTAFVKTVCISTDKKDLCRANSSHTSTLGMCFAVTSSFRWEVTLCRVKGSPGSGNSCVNYFMNSIPARENKRLQELPVTDRKPIWVKAASGIELWQVHVLLQTASCSFFFFVQEAGKGKERTKRRLKMCSMQTLSDAIGIFLITSQEVSEERWKFLEYKKYARTSLLSQITFSKH